MAGVSIDLIRSRFEVYRHLIADFDLFCARLCQPAPTYVRLNTLKAPAALTRRRLASRGLALAPVDQEHHIYRLEDDIGPGRLLEYALGHLHAQALSSALAVLALAPAPGTLVLDLCAAPGGKTAFMAQLMDNRGTIVANDVSGPRLVALKSNLKRLGVANTIVTRYPGQSFTQKIKFDHVLVDAPCSAEGTIRMRPGGRPPAAASASPRLLATQKGLLLRGFDLLKAGGTLLYATCTYNPLENEAVVQSLLETRLPAKVVPIELDYPHCNGILRWQEKEYDPGIVNCWRLYPHQLDTVGFFLAKIAKCS